MSSSKHKAERDRLIKYIAEKRAKLDARRETDNIKVRRINTPPEFKVNCEPLYSIPPEFAKKKGAGGALKKAEEKKRKG